MNQKLKKEDVHKALAQDLQIKNTMAVPQIKKIVLNMGLKDALKDQKILDEAVMQLGQIAGQKPVVTKAKVAIAGFKLRKGDAIGAMVTLRGKRMDDFFEKLVSVVLPRVRDFRGVPTTSFDGNGNYTLGFTGISVFPEIDMSTIGRINGMEVTIVTSAVDNEGARALLTKMGMPFRKENKR